MPACFNHLFSMFLTGLLVPAVYLCSVSSAPAQTSIQLSPPSQPLSYRLDHPSASMVKRSGVIKQRERTHWPEEVLLRRISPKLDQFFASLQTGSFDKQEPSALFHPDFTGSVAPQNISSTVQEANAVSWQAFDINQQRVVSKTAFTQSWTDYVSAYQSITRTEYQISSIKGASSDSASPVSLQVHFRLTGTGVDGRQEDQGQFGAVFIREPGNSNAWRMSEFSLKKLERVSGRQQFQDVSEQLGARVETPQDTHLVAYFSQGVSLSDFDGDDDLDLFFPQRNAAAIAYRNDGKGHFDDVTSELGLSGLSGARVAYFFDWDNDADLDMLLLTSKRMFLFENDGKRFSDVSQVSGFDRMQTTGLIGAAIADFNQDGLLDFYVCNYGDPVNGPGFDYFDSNKGFVNKLFQNKGNGKFADVTSMAGLDKDNRRWTFSALWIDYDQDTAMDLYVVNDYGPNQLFRNLGNGQFSDVALEVGVQDYGNGMGASWADYNNDTYMDLYISNMHSDVGKRVLHSSNYSGSSEARDKALRFAKGNTLLRNTGKGGFVEVEDSPLINAKWAWGNLFFDYDNDGDQDLYVANGMFSNSSMQDVGPVFWRHVLAPASLEDPFYLQGGAYLGDLIKTQAHSFAGYEHNRFFQNLGDGRFADAGSVLDIDLVQDSRGVASGDLDNDGDLDLVISNRNAPQLVVLKNNVSNPGNYLAVLTEGSNSNRQGIGARLTLACEGKKQVRVIQLGSGFVSQSDQTAWFGLGKCKKVDSLKVQWPSGHQQIFTSIAINQKILVKEAKSKLSSLH